ncbi:MAG: hypothetical protein ACYCQI_01865 [Gammaproteobacteria bacterium]
MLSAQTEWQTITAEGGGNCAFNAFILGLKKVIDDDQLQPKNPDVTYHDFLIEFNNATGKEATWSAFVAYIRATETVRLQNELHQLLRNFSINLLRKKQGLHGQRHQEAMFEPVKAGFHNYILQQLGTPVTQTTFSQDDICERLSCVKTEFAALFKSEFEVEFVKYKELAAATRDAAKELEFNALRVKLEDKIANIQQTTLLDTWNKKLYAQSLDAMDQVGAWAGDLELAPLANYFDVELDIQREHRETKSIMTHHIHYDYGQFDSEELKDPKDVIPRLITLDVVDRDPVSKTSYRWKNHFEEKELAKVLSQVPGHDTVESVITRSESEVQQNKGLKGCKLKPSLPSHIISTLETAGVVTNKSEGVCFDITKEDYESRVKNTLSASVQQIVDGEILRVEDRIQGKVVDSSLFSSECIEQLSQRGVVKGAGTDKLVFVLGEKDVRDRIADVPGKSHVLTRWKSTHRQLPLITLANESAAHWNLKVPKPATAAVIETQKATASLPSPKAAPSPKSAATEVKSSAVKLANIEPEAITLKYKNKPEVEDNKWKKIINEVESAIGHDKKLTKEVTVNLPEKSIKIAPVVKGITYTFTDSVKVEVDEQTQKDLDWELAEKLQREEYNNSLKR